MEIFERFWNALVGIYTGSGLMNLDWRNYVMIAVACVLFFLAIKKQFEPLLLLPIAFGMLLV
ncbi:MAG: sodium ion-translocating decarboxylase subunit beta, partial [Ruminococcus sp.]|nr:sodium ion-translocating decarboxylase subunit beta [Ruminococcus sp.]